MTHRLTTPEYVCRHVIPAAFACLPAGMRSPQASAMILAIGLQESKFKHRVQVNGPARGFFQFEAAGVAGVLRHKTTKDHLLTALDTLCYKRTLPAAVLHKALEHHDVLACVFARLNLWWLPDPLPGREEPELAWNQYMAAWRPGRPHHDTWHQYYRQAWSLVDAE